MTATAAHTTGFVRAFGTRRGRLSSHPPRGEDVKFEAARTLWGADPDANAGQALASSLVRQIEAGDPSHAIELLNLGGQLHIKIEGMASIVFANGWLDNRPNPHAAAVLGALVARARQPSEAAAEQAITDLTSHLWLKPKPKMSAVLKKVRHSFDASAYSDCLRAINKGQLTEASATEIASWTTPLTSYLGNYCYRNNDMVLRAFELQNMGSLGPAAWEDAASRYCHARAAGLPPARAISMMSAQLRKALGL